MNIFPGSPEPNGDYAKSLGLDKINYKNQYTLSKIGSKNPSLYGNATYVTRGSILIISDKDSAMLYISNRSEWFRTSPVLSIKKVKGGFKIETENSFYKLEKV